MTENQRADLRIGDADREGALRALGEHMAQGRLDVHEFGERSAQVAAAKTRGELLAVFGDLPPPHPVLDASPVPAAAPPPELAGHRPPPLAQRLYSGLIPLSGVIGVVLFLTLLRGFFPILLLPIVLVMVGGAIFGPDWNHRGRYGHRGRGVYRGRRHH